MPEPTTRDDLVSALTAAGDAFTGGRVEEIANEWADYFSDLAEAIRWIEAGYWDAGSAGTLSDHGAEPGSVRYRDGHGRDNGYGVDPAYAYCNSDCSIDDLTWE